MITVHFTKKFIAGPLVDLTYQDKIDFPNDKLAEMFVAKCRELVRTKKPLKGTNYRITEFTVER